MQTWCRLGCVAIAVLIGAACGGDQQTTVATTVATTSSASAPEIVDVYRNLEYYGACGNETVRVDGTVFYPVPSEPSEHVVPGVAEAIDESRYPLPPDPTGVVRVAPPGPGDDIGMMIVYSDGFVRFESVSGWTIWLTDQEQTYGWEC